jgi:hypothetical protein
MLSTRSSITSERGQKKTVAGQVSNEGQVQIQRGTALVATAFGTSSPIGLLRFDLYLSPF